MFVDKVGIYVRAGNGGDGAATFRREKFVPNGGPDGGDGGDGGSVFFVTEKNITTLVDFKNRNHFMAENGGNGSGGNRHGKNGKDILIKVPMGTVIKERESDKVITDLNKDQMEYKLLSGGRGGLGNQHFATSRRQAPKYAEKGKEGAELNLILELKMIADVGLIGFPNAGKSTLLSASTNAKPKIASYQFTTLIPNLGVVNTKIGKSFLMADIPGLIEDAHKGVGLGHAFLRHVERTKMLIHVVDVAGTEGRNPLVDIEKINLEIELYSKNLAKKPQVLALNKIDLLYDDDTIIKQIQEEHPDVKVFPISAVAHKGLDELFNYVACEIEKHEQEEVTFRQEFFVSELEDSLEESWIDVRKEKEHLFIVSGKAVDKMLGYTNLDTEKGFAFLQQFLKEKGIIKRLEELGIKEEDLVRLGDLEFKYYK